MNSTRTCPRCRQPLPPDAPQGLCPECLMQAALESQPAPDRTRVLTETDIREHRLPSAGEQFGGYRIIRELGHGGMGAVYEAEQIETGRRVALKVLSHQLDSPDARARFLREGRLAASINHPNSVYVFGTEEIEGTAVIVMELVAGGTLQQRVQRNGPLTVNEAVDSVLHIIAGLEAAQAIGILHRDIKPANCFEDVDGTVKVGDFGLSISTAPRAETNITVQGAFLGTPAFCSPEQLRGEELSVRSDIYSVGVTLFYLLTGRTPFEGKNMVQLLANVIEQPAPSARKLRPQIPAGLSAAVSRCLAKQPADRFKSYEELRQALAPYSSEAPVAAPLALRLVAGVVDTCVLSAVMMPTGMAVLGGFRALQNPAAYQSREFFLLMLSAWVGWLLYYTLLEGRWGASVGKAICRLRVIGADRNPPGFGKAATRASIFIAIQVLPYWAAFGLNPMGILNLKSDLARYLWSVTYYILLAAIFSTARRRNGLAAVHDLLTRTRVIRRIARQSRMTLAAQDEAPTKTEAAPRVGPFHIIESLGKTSECEWLLGYDTRLLRKVWIGVAPAGTRPVAQELRNISRVGRLRWITGRRTDTENWDAFEGLSGASLRKLVVQPHPWSEVRFWLLDLATELAAAERDGTLPTVLALDRVWITGEGRAKLLDFPAPGITEEHIEISARTAADFLDLVARAALAADNAPRAGEIKAPLPLYARKFLSELAMPLPADKVAASLKPLIQRVPAVSRARRAVLVGGCIIFPLFAVISGSFGLRLLSKWQQSQPEITRLANVLNIRAAFRLPWTKHHSTVSDDAFAIYIAANFRDTILKTNGGWHTLYALSMIPGEKREFAEQAVKSHPQPTAKEIADATVAVEKLLPPPEITGFVLKPWFPFLMGGAALIMYVAIPAVISALLFRGGLVLLAAGVAVVRRDGLRASRLRVFWRSLVVWAPVFFGAALAGGLVPFWGALNAALAMYSALLVLTALSLALPDRGIPDRLAGTRLVPR